LLLVVVAVAALLWLNQPLPLLVAAVAILWLVLVLLLQVLMALSWLHSAPYLLVPYPVPTRQSAEHLLDQWSSAACASTSVSGLEHFPKKAGQSL
jgi:hypothetical protein